MAQTTPEIAYCAFSTARAYAAQHRNYGNCQECKKAHQKCNGSDGIACDRCIKLKKDCSLLNTTSPVRFPMEAHASQLTSQRPSIDDERQRFGQILYARPCDGGACIDVIHARMGVNNHCQVFRTKCDRNFIPVTPIEYLGPWAEFISRMQASMTEVDVADMITMAFESDPL
ncbi:hypothetical protein ACEPAF_5369 [Sanghuangporus sanghuang]